MVGGVFTAVLHGDHGQLIAGRRPLLSACCAGGGVAVPGPGILCSCRSQSSAQASVAGGRRRGCTAEVIRSRCWSAARTSRRSAPGSPCSPTGSPRCGCWAGRRGARARGPHDPTLRTGQRQPSGRWLVEVPPGSTQDLAVVHRQDLQRVLLVGPAGRRRAHGRRGHGVEHAAGSSRTPRGRGLGRPGDRRRRPGSAVAARSPRRLAPVRRLHRVARFTDDPGRPPRHRR